MYDVTWEISQRVLWTIKSKQCHGKCTPEAHYGGFNRVLPPDKYPIQEEAFDTPRDA